MSTINLAGVDTAVNIVKVRLGTSEHALLMAAGWTLATLQTRVNALGIAGKSIDSVSGTAITTTGIDSIELIDVSTDVVDDFESYGEDSPHPDVVSDNDISSTDEGRNTLTYVPWEGPTTFGSTDGALNTGNYRVGSAATISGTSNFPPGGRVGSMGRFWLVSKGWTDADGVVHDNYLPPGTDGHTDAKGDTLGRYLAIDAGTHEAEYFRKTYMGAPAGLNDFQFSLAASCIGPSYDDRTVPCEESPSFTIVVYAADGVTELGSYVTGSMVNDGIWKPYHILFELPTSQDIVISVQNNNIVLTDPAPGGNDFLIDEMGLSVANKQEFSRIIADAVVDNMGNIPTGSATTVDISTNDTVCSEGTTTFELIGSPTNGTVTLTGSIATVTPAAPGAGSQNYVIKCDGVTVDEDTITWSGMAEVVDDVEGTVTVQLVDPRDNSVIAEQVLSAKNYKAQGGFNLIADDLDPDIDYEVKATRSTLTGVLKGASVTSVKAITTTTPKAC